MTVPSSTPPTAPTAPAWATPGDPGGHVAHQLMLVRTGRKSRAPGIRRCDDCREPFVDDHTGLPWCTACRVAHRRRCADCDHPFPNTAAGDRRCTCCREQLPLFDTALTDTDGGSTS